MPAARTAVLIGLLLLPAVSAAQTRVSEAARVPLTFEENRGQTDPRVCFLARGKGYTLFLTGDGAAFDLASDDRPGTAFRMTLDGARPAERISGVDPLPGRSHYFRGSDARRWTTGIPTYGKVRYESVYRGIDLVYYSNQQQLEYDFVVAPGASPSAIRVRFAGVRDLRVAPAGDLMMRAGDRELRQPKPLVFQEVNGKRREIAAGYVLDANGAVGFDVGEYDRSLPLTVDPVLIYSTLWGEQFGDVRDIAADASGNSYVIGTSMSVVFPTTVGAWRRLADGEYPDLFVTKFDTTGAVIYST